MKLIYQYLSKNIICGYEKHVIRFTSLTLFIQLLLSINLWKGARDFPLIPVIESLDLLQVFQFPLLFLFLLVLITNIIAPNRNGLKLLVTCYLFMILFDINRLQPWSYVYLVIYTLSSFENERNNSSILKGGVQLLIVGLFIWSGVSKMNTNFLEGTFIVILTETFRLNDITFFINHLELGFFVPITEILAGLLLLFRKTRKLGVGLVICSHIFIIYFVSPLSIGSDSIVIPWNLLMIYLVLISFYNATIFEGFQWEERKEKFIKVGTIVVVLILPILNQFGKWDHFMSFSLYSNTTDNVLVAVQEEYIPNLSTNLRKRFIKSNDYEGGRILNLSNWSKEVLNVPIYPEEWVHNKICKQFCQFGVPSESLIFLKINGAVKQQNISKYFCEEL